MKLSEQGIDELIQLEGKENRAYRDIANHYTIGVGHLISKREINSGKIEINGEFVDWQAGLTDNQIKNLLRQDVKAFEKAVENIIFVPLTQRQFDAITIFAFNIGIGAFHSSTLVRQLNKGNYDAVPAQLMRWNRAGGKISKGLTNRRNAEIKIWNS